MQTIASLSAKRISFFKKSVLLEIIAGLFILLFVYTAISKFADMPRFIFAIMKIPFITQLGISPKIVGWSIPISELAISALLFFKRPRLIGFACSTILMLVFTIHISYMLISMETLPCNCGGVIGELSWKQHLVFNIAWLLMGGAAWRMEYRYRNSNR